MGLRLWNIVKSTIHDIISFNKKGIFFNLFRQSKFDFVKNIREAHTLSDNLTSFGIAKKLQYLIAVGIVLFVFGGAVYFVRQIYALTLYFTQSDWSGGADTNATINSSNATGWTKFYSKTAGIDNSSSGEIKLKLESSP